MKVVGSYRLPPLAAVYHFTPVPVTEIFEILLFVHRFCVVEPVGAATLFTVIVMDLRKVVPLEVTSTKYVVVCVGLGLMVSVVSPVDQR
jgi:hypothetical protein